MIFTHRLQRAGVAPLNSFSAMPKALSLALASTLILAACGGGGSSPGTQATNPPTGGGTPNEVGEIEFKATTALPPGQSGFVSTQGQSMGQASGVPGDYGENLDDQRELYWSFAAKDGQFHKKGDPISPKAGVEIYLDEFGIPAVYADNIEDVWFGAGYIIAQQRLFLMDAVRHLGNGNFAELLGCGSLAADIMQRTVSYDDAEYQVFMDELHQDSQDAVIGYKDGVNAWLSEVRTDPNKLPAEYGLLSIPAQQIPDFTAKDLLASGVLITRSVATDGGTEWQNIRALRALEASFGQADGRKAFMDLNWVEDDKAASTIPASVATFANHPVSAAGREATFNAAADYATNLPDTLEHGPGTGVVTLPITCGDSSGGIFTGLGDPQGQTRSASTRSASVQSSNPIAEAIQAVQTWGANLHGGSYMVVMNGDKTKDNTTLMVNGPQLGYSYPSQLVEIEIHAGEYNARGSTVPGLPSVGIGYNDDIAWGLTTGYSKTIDSFIDTICSTQQISDGDCSEDQYFHNNTWKDMDCRTETFNYRPANAGGAPAGPASLSVDQKICRTIHGPVVARDDAAGLARTLSYAMWMKEIRNIDPIREWARAKSFADADATVKDLTWNENLMLASRDGNVAFYHPGQYPRRHADTDQRFPINGSGEHDFNGVLSYSEMPKVINPPEGYVANWNNKPAHDWLGGEGISSHSRPGGSRERVSVIQDLVQQRDDWDFSSLQELDKRLGTIDPKAGAYLPVMLAYALNQNANLTDRQRAAIAKISDWDGTFYDYSLDINDEAAKAKPATTIFTYWVNAIRDELFSSLKTMQLDGFQTPSDDTDDDSIFDRQTGVGNHVFDMSVLDNLAVRILSPASSSLNVRYNWTSGRSANAVLTASLNNALDTLEADFSSTSADDFERTHPRSDICSLTGGVIGPCITMPYQDRGSWNQILGWEPADE